MKKQIILLACLIPSLGFGQLYSIQWFKIAGGGGVSAGGQYSVNSTIGQPDASSAMSGGNYSVTGGYWAISVVQSAGAPVLNMLRSGASIVVSWPYPSTGFVLQQSPDLNSTNWTASTFTINTNNSVNSVTINAGSGNLFLRLKK